MGAPASPVATMMAQQLAQRLAGLNGGGQGAPGGSPSPSPAPAGPGGQSPDAAGGALSQQLSQVSGADPEMMVKSLTNIKGMLVAIFNRSAFQLPSVGRQVAQAMKYIDNAIKDSQQAAQTVQTVKAQITNNAAVSAPASGGDSGGM